MSYAEVCECMVTCLILGENVFVMMLLLPNLSGGFGTNKHEAEF